MPARTNTTRFVLGFLAVLVALPTLVWGIQAIQRDGNDPSPATSTADEPRRTEPFATPVPAAPPEPKAKPRREPRRATMAAAAATEAEDCASRCPLGTIEAETTGESVEQIEATDEPRDATELVGVLLAPKRELRDRLEEVAEETLGRINLPKPTDTIDAPEVPDLEIQLGRAPVEPDAIPAPDAIPETDPDAIPDPVPAVDPPTELAPDPTSEDPAAPEPSEPTALLVLDKRTAEELDVPSRMTITLNDAVRRALVILSERTGLDLSIAVPGSPEPSRD